MCYPLLIKIIRIFRRTLDVQYIVHITYQISKSFIWNLNFNFFKISYENFVLTKLIVDLYPDLHLRKVR
jgi:hypothetical protein